MFSYLQNYALGHTVYQNYHQRHIITTDILFHKLVDVTCPKTSIYWEVTSLRLGLPGTVLKLNRKLRKSIR